MEEKLMKQTALHYPKMLQMLWQARIKMGDWYYNLHERDMTEIQTTINLIEQLYKDVEEAGQLHLETILELQRIQSFVHPKDEAINQSIGVALVELEEKFQKIHDRWSEGN